MFYCSVSHLLSTIRRLTVSYFFLRCFQVILTFFIHLRIRNRLRSMILQPDMVQGERYRVQRLFPLRRLQLALPYRDAMPAHLSQPPLLLLVPLFVPPNLRHPELPVRLRNLAATFSFIISPFSFSKAPCPCQKHPFTKMHVRYFLSTKSGCPGNRL